MLISHRETSKSAMTDIGPFQIDFSKSFQLQKSYVDQHLNEWKDRKGLFALGGVGRLTNYALSLGLEVDCMDASTLCEGVCKREYPNVNFIKANAMTPVSSYDYLFLEDLIYGFIPTSFWGYLINNWQMYNVPIYPKYLSYNVYRFNSQELDERFYLPEETARAYIKKVLTYGHTDIYFCENELTDFTKEVINIDLNKPLPVIAHDPHEGKKYTILSRCTTNPNDVVRGKIFNSGYRKNFRTNQIVIDPPYVPEHHRTNRDPIPNDVL